MAIINDWSYSNPFNTTAVTLPYIAIHDMLKEQYPNSGYCSVIKKIIKDEYQHQQALFEILNDAKAFFPDKVRDAMKKAEEAYGRV